jgi:NTP pyrophosphatase (non-canonical NTP hydrolase)
MRLNDYQILAKRTSGSLVPEQQILNGVMGLNGEAGECIDLVKKHLFQGHTLDREKLINELGDVLWYIAQTATGLGIELGDVAERNIDKLKARYPDGFSDARSINREESL